jgi:hypothetical protein
MNKGNQKPRIDIYHDGDISLAEKIITLLDSYNRTPLQWQKAILRRWMARDDEDKWANQTAGLIVPRQNGKSWLAEARILGGMIFLGEHLIYTAHQSSTVDEIKRRILRFFYDAEPEIRDLLTSEFDKEPKSFDYIELRNGGRCIFRTRTRSSGLGFTSDAIVNDECFLADTIVDGKCIQDIRVGDMVRSLNKYGEIEYRKVTRLIKKPRPQVLTSLKIGDKELVSTGNHRHLTQRGWVRAEDIKVGDYLFYDKSREVNGLLATIKATVQNLQRKHRLSKHHAETDLQEKGLLLLLQHRLFKCRKVVGDERSPQAQQSNVERGIEREDESYSTSDKLQATSSGWKWHRPDRSTEKVMDLIRQGLEAGISDRDWSLSEGRIQHADSLQTRLGQQGAEARSGMRWKQPLHSRKKTTRCEEGCRFRAVRVDGIAIQERTNLDRAGLSDGGDYVYCIDVEENHNFIANGFITHNCQEQNDAQEEALLPTISAGPLQNPQVIMMGTPPTAGSTGTVFIRARRNLLQGKSDIAWQEWSVENITDNYDIDAWYQTNPSLGYLITEKAIRAEAGAMSQDSFNKMRLGWYAGLDDKRVISDDEWNALAVKEVKLPENPQLAYAVKFAPDRSAVTLAVGVIMGEKIHVEVIERKRMSDGMAWLVRWLLDRWRKASCIVVDGAAGQGLLVEELLRSEPKIKKRLLTPNVKEAGSAYASFYQAIQDGTLTHYNQPLLNSAIRTAKRRDIGKDGMFGYAPLNPSIQMDPVDAVAFAYYSANRFGRSKKGPSKQTFRAF